MVSHAVLVEEVCVGAIEFQPDRVTRLERTQTGSLGDDLAAVFQTRMHKGVLAQTFDKVDLRRYDWLARRGDRYMFGAQTDAPALVTGQHFKRDVGRYDRAGRDKMDDEEIVRVWYSERNFERRDRAIELAEKLGRQPIHIALAYVLAQPFPVIPLIGPRNLTELEDSLSALNIELTPEQVKWLEAGKSGKKKAA